MSGNVWEWCWDWTGVYHSVPQVDPIGPPTGSRRVNRGGGGTTAKSLCEQALEEMNIPIFAIANRVFDWFGTFRLNLSRRLVPVLL